jgi:pyruvate kinase
MFRGVYALPFDTRTMDREQISQAAVQALVNGGLLEKGDWVIITKGDTSTDGGTNTLRIVCAE